MIDYVTAGESHGPQLTGILTGLPAGLTIDVDAINAALAARQGGFGRGNRQQIEHDTVTVTGGLRHGVTLGSPLALTIQNRDHAHWQQIMDPVSPATPENSLRQVTRPRPGHADLVGGMKYGHRDLRNVLERSSARETAMRVALGQLCKQLLAQLDIDLIGYVQQIGPIQVPDDDSLDVAALRQAVTSNDLRIVADQQVSAIHDLITATKKAGDTLGGVIRVVATNVPAGLGSYTNWNTKLDGQLAAAVMGVNAMKGVEIGDGFAAAARYGSEVMDSIAWDATTGWSRLSNHLGGFEGGMTNGMPVIVKAAMKPIPTLYKPLQSVDIDSKVTQKASVERSDTTAIVPASIVVESVVAIELARALTATFDGSNLARLQAQVHAYRAELQVY
ncbi:chorismate synthase [Lactiplantibacillus fabifermentans]|uniref:Chorismate synthase n=2 Tax=Lactiplantibacillus fabifermentans TaxID=483011 RepID=A0A0R2NNU2_9LACO|nr:chorismate synthase [Lactiplantibacillus fabifermentans]ETY74657.1 chorismate synthase [Lactiplantibacillus fabifermentans T30PCM01]KRO26096.1 chorismate synthase [Lactiplantibacillus fabifermentans DSM 21115]